VISGNDTLQLGDLDKAAVGPAIANTPPFQQHVKVTSFQNSDKSI
jgi:hypothetical protein